MSSVEYNIRAFKKKTSILNPKHLIVSVNDNNHPSSLYSTWSGSNYELADLVSSLGRPFMLNAKKLLDHASEAREQLKDDLKDYMTPTDNGIVVNWEAFSTRVEETVRSMLINDELGLARLSPITIKTRQRKGVGGETPLVATGELANAIICYPQ